MTFAEALAACLRDLEERRREAHLEIDRMINLERDRMRAEIRALLERERSGELEH